jgi:methionyl-tRNA formyltransferase
MINGERDTGLSVITIADRMDAGDVLEQAGTAIDPHETAGELHDRLAEMGPELILKVLVQRAANSVMHHPQNEYEATKARKLCKADGTVSFDQPAPAVRCRVHGLTPWPGCWIRIGGRPLRLHRVDVAPKEYRDHSTAGTLLADMNIACGDSAEVIHVLDVQPPNGKLMTFQAYCNGHGVKAGERLSSA